jgi:hypothetical protein
MADADDHLIRLRAQTLQDEAQRPFWHGIALPVQLVFGIILILIVLAGYWRGRP